MLNALSVFLDGGNEDGPRRAARSFEQQGFLPATRFEWEGGVLHTWMYPSQSEIENCIVQTSTGTACCIGPLWYRGQYGVAALRSLLDDMITPAQIDETKLRGNYVLFLYKNGCVWLMNDALGFVRLYSSHDSRFYSTSWLAALAYEGHAEIDEAAAVEYVLLGASHSDRTIARGITILPLGNALDLTTRRTWPRFPAGIWTGAQTLNSFGTAVETISAYLQTVFSEIVTAFPGRVNAALSGGFDSRLIVAGLLACGERPKLFVYGDSESKDVAIAREIAKTEGITLNVVNKNKINQGLPLPDIEGLIRSALFFDGLPNDGIYDPGADQRTRLEQTAGGYLALNGGGGEIFRNFFHLPDRIYSAQDLVRAFYRGFDPAVFRRSDGLASYQEGLAVSISRSLGIGRPNVNEKLAREQVEMIYPLFRCHYWMGVNNSVAVRQGYYVTPLIDLQTMRAACMLPLTWKNAGRLESLLITTLHQTIANHLSVYSFRFSDGPGLRGRWLEWSTCRRPVFVRPFINAIRRRLHKLGVSPNMIAHCRALLPGEWQLDPLLDLERLPNNEAFARALAVEVVWRKIAPS